MRPYTAPDYGVRPSQGGYVVERTEYLIDRWGDKCERTENVSWHPSYAQADAVRADLQKARKRL